MNSFLNNEPSRHSILGSKEENIIREIFYKHWEKMKTQMETVAVGIHQWRSQSIQEINRYANAQLHILQTHYNRQGSIFEQKREENLELAKAYHLTKKPDLFQELSNACKSLQFQLAQLEKVEYQNNTVRPIVISQGQQIQRKSPNNTSAHAGGYETMNSCPQTTFSQAIDAPARTNTNNSSAYNETSDNLENKCPICFMIFPLNMASKDRERHVNEHMVDNSDAHVTSE